MSLSMVYRLSVLLFISIINHMFQNVTLALLKLMQVSWNRLMYKKCYMLYNVICDILYDILCIFELYILNMVQIPIAFHNTKIALLQNDTKNYKEVDWYFYTFKVSSNKSTFSILAAQPVELANSNVLYALGMIWLAMSPVQGMVI